MIFSFRLTLRQLPGNRITLTVPLPFRLLLAGIGFLIFFALVITTPGGTRMIFVAANTVPLILSAVSFLAAAYNEQWIFDKEKDRLISRFGIAVLNSKRLMKISDLAKVASTQFTRGRLPGSATSGTQEGRHRGLFRKHLLSLVLVLQNGEIVRLETYNAAQRDRVEQMALKISGYCGIPFNSDKQF